MAVENITLNIIPTGDTPSIHVAQFDVDRPFTVTLKEGEDDFTPIDYTIELQVRKVDATIVTVLPAQTSGNVVTFNTTEQMTACSGTNIAELQLTKDSQTFATLHFYLVVQRDVLAGGVTSESDIYNLTEQIAAIVPEVIGDDYYNKEEVDEKIAEIPTFDPTNYYDKSETDALLNDKADVSDLPDMNDYYTKSEVDTKITDLYQINTVSGDIAHFIDGGDNIPVNSFECDIGATGFSQADIVVCGKNLFDNTNIALNRYIDNDGNVISVGAIGWCISDYISVKSGYTYTASGLSKGGSGTYIALYDINKNVTRTILMQANTNNTFTVNDGEFYIRLSVRTAQNEYKTAQLELGETATTYEPYNGITYTVTFGSTFNEGLLVYENGAWYIDVSGTITPITSSTRVKTISGENNIFSNTGACEVDYFTEKSDGIAELIKAFM